MEMHIVGDTIYGGNECKYLKQSGVTYSYSTRDTVYFVKNYFAYQDGAKIFIADSWSTEFHLSYDMSLAVGDTLGGGQTDVFYDPTIWFWIVFHLLKLREFSIGRSILGLILLMPRFGE